jgi:peroxiredoxin
VQLQSDLSKIKALKAQVVAVSADNFDTALNAKASLRLKFTILPDPNKEVIRRYSVLHPDEGIARPAVFIIDKEGVVRFRYIGKNAADRPKNVRLLNALRWL